MIGVLLAGGFSRRFKQDKALFYDPRFQTTWLELAIERMTGITDTCCIIANLQNCRQMTEKAERFSATILTDLPEVAGQGPLSGIYTAAKHYPGEEILITAIDYPFLTRQSLQKLTRYQNAYAVTENQPHFTIAHLMVDDQLLALLETVLRNKELRLGDFLKKIPAKAIELPASELRTTNTPIDEYL